jgi:hypothetical protein
MPSLRHREGRPFLSRRVDYVTAASFQVELSDTEPLRNDLTSINAVS